MVEESRWYNFTPTTQFLLNVLAHPQPNLHPSWALKSNMEEKVVDTCRYWMILHIGKPTELVKMMRMPLFRGFLINSKWPWSPHGRTTHSKTRHFIWLWNRVGSTKGRRKVLLVRRRSGHGSLSLKWIGQKMFYGWMDKWIDRWINGWMDVVHSSIQHDGAEKLCNN